MDEKQKEKFFIRNKRYYIQANKLNYETLEEYRIADALAYAHDELNPKITNEPSKGIWLSRLRKVGNKAFSKYEIHIIDKINQGLIKSAKEYNEQCYSLLNNEDNDVYITYGMDNNLRHIIRNEATKWIIMLNKYGLIETAYKANWTKKHWSTLIYKGKLKTI